MIGNKAPKVLFVVISALFSSQGLSSPTRLSMTLGTPAAAMPGLSFGLQIHPQLEATASVGYFSHGDQITILPGSILARLRIFEASTWNPLADVGITRFHFSGNDAWRGLTTSLTAGTVGVGFQYRPPSTNLDLSLGTRVHFPSEIWFPFFELGFIFEPTTDP